MRATSSSPTSGPVREPGVPIGLVAVVGAALIAVTANGPALGIALPTLATDLGAGQAQVTWMSTAAGVVSASALLPVAAAAERYGRRRFLAGGLLLFALAAIGTGLAASPTTYIALQAVAGLATACVLPTSLALIVAAFPREQRARAVALWAATVSVSASLSGLASGQLTTASSWRIMPVLLGVTALVVVVPVWLTTRDDRTRDAVPDPLGGLLVLVGVGALILGVGQSGQAPLTDPAVLGPLVLGVVALAAFVAWELRTASPMLPVRLFRHRNLQAGALLLLLVTGSFAAYTFIGVQYLQNVRGLSELQSALVFLVTEAGVVAAAVVVPRLVRRGGVRWVGTAGALVVALAFVLLAVSVRAPTLWPHLTALLLLGVGFALAITPASTLVLTGLPPDRLTTASAVTYLGRDVGGAMGTAVVGAILLAIYQSRVAPLLPTLPAPVADEVDSGINAAFGAVDQLGPGSAAVLDQARDAFLEGFRGGAVGAAVAAALGALACALLAPSGLRESREIDPEITPTPPATPPTTTSTTPPTIPPTTPPAIPPVERTSS